MSNQHVAGPLQEYTYRRVTYYVDYRLKQFKTKAKFPDLIKFINFDDDYGDRILAKMIRDGVADESKLHL